MKDVRLFFAGILFGIILTRSEVISWFRIQEMFRFQSFHMYGIICLAIIIGGLSVQCIKRYQLKDIDGQDIVIEDQDNRMFLQYIVGGFIFGVGWAFTGACPGPLYALVGTGVWVAMVPLFMAVVGAFFYGILREKLPH